MTRADARIFLATYAATSASPALTEAEAEACIDQARVVDAEGLLITDEGYEETIWATRAVVLALDAKVAKASTEVDFSADGTQVSGSQLVQHLAALRRSWRSRMVPGSV